MQKSKIFLSFLAPIATITTILPIITLTSCNNKPQPTPEQPTITKVEVTSSKQVLKINRSIQLSVNVTGTGDFSKEVSWSVAAGSGTVSETGYFTAGASSGVSTIKATSKADSTKFGTVSISITDQTPVVKNVKNGTIAGPTEISEIGSANFSLTPETGYKLPNAITVTGATGQDTYNPADGTFTLSNPTTDEVIINAECVEITIDPTITINNLDIPASFGTKGDYVSNVKTTKIKLGQSFEITCDISPEKYLIYGVYSTITIGSNIYYLDSDGITYDSDNHKITVDGSLVNDVNIQIVLNAGDLVAPTSSQFQISFTQSTEVVEVGDTYDIGVKVAAGLEANDRKFKLNIESSTLSVDDYVEYNPNDLKIKGKQVTDNNKLDVYVYPSSKYDYRKWNYSIQVIPAVTKYNEIPSYWDKNKNKFTTGTISLTKDESYKISFDFNEITSSEYINKPWKWQSAVGLNRKVYIDNKKAHYNIDYEHGSGTYHFLQKTYNTFTSDTVITLKFTSNYDSTQSEIWLNP